MAQCKGSLNNPGCSDRLDERVGRLAGLAERLEDLTGPEALCCMDETVARAFAMTHPPVINQACCPAGPEQK